MKHVVVIGSGLGGLECGYILARSGYKVTVLEHDAHLGGCLQSFRRGTTLFDTGLHYVGGLKEGGALYPLFRYFDLLNLPWKRLDEDCAEEVCIGEKKFALAQGHERFFETMAERFPQEKAGLRCYTDTLRSIGEQSKEVLRQDYTLDERMQEWMGKSAQEWLCETISDPLLRDVLAGNSLKMELTPDLPLYVFAEIQNSYIQSAYRLEGGGNQIADRLRDHIVSHGGEVRLQATVTRIQEEQGKVTGVEVNGTESIPADIVISDTHPATTLSLLKDSTAIRPIYRRRITALPNAYGMFTCNIRLKPDALPYINRNIYLHRGGCDLWNIDTSRVNHLLIHMYPDQPAIDLLTPMRFSDVAHWSDRPQGRREEDYVAFKEDIAQQCIALAAQRLPDLPDAIEHIYTSTPLTYAGSLLSPEGTAYGIRKDCRNPMLTFLSPRTPVKDLYLTGQSLNLHGILGVSMTSVLTCKEILGCLPEGLEL